MQPEVSNTLIGSERAPVATEQNMDRLPMLPAPELGGIETGADRKEQAAELLQVASDVAGGALPIDPAAMTQPALDPAASSVNPLVAGHDDLIEKEWVSRA